MIAFLRKHTWVFIVICAVAVFPQALTTQAVLNMRILVTGVAIDKKEDSFYVTAQVIRPQAGSVGGGEGAKVGFVEAEGPTLATAMQKIGYKVGKTVGFSQLNFIMIGESVAQENLLLELDYLYRDITINPAVMLLLCDGEAKESIQKTEKLELDIAFGLQKAFIYKQSALNGIATPIRDVYNEYFNPSQSTLISYIMFEDKTNSASSGQTGGGESSGGEGGASSGASSQADKKNEEIMYFNPIGIVKNGTVVGKIEDVNAIMGVLLANKKTYEGVLYLQDVEGENGETGDVSILVREKKYSTRAYFSNGKPVFEMNISMDKVLVKEISTDKVFQESYLSFVSYITNNLTNVIQNEIQMRIEKALEEGKAYDADIFQMANKFYAYHPKEWEAYIEQNSFTHFLNNVEVKINVTIRSTN